ncbi:Uncharacterised protein [Raoultella planticola]|uniref:Uncharacterized protein n=1 Tax=Raoultella planticola TaxID=575 RepID=A0A485CLA9_RAOPL|nr:Uncharacterised protein [Raoultella planticola]
MIQLSFREVGLLITAERYVKFAAQIIATQAIVTMAVQIQEQHRTTQRILTLIEFSTELIVLLCRVILRP